MSVSTLSGDLYSLTDSPWASAGRARDEALGLEGVRRAGRAAALARLGLDVARLAAHARRKVRRLEPAGGALGAGRLAAEGRGAAGRALRAGGPWGGRA